MLPESNTTRASDFFRMDKQLIRTVDCPGHSQGRCQVLNGTHYSVETPLDLVVKLEQLRAAGERLRFVLGENGKEWGDVEIGRIGRSGGTCKIPLVVHNRRSMGGGGLLDHCIVRIETSKGRRVLWSRS